MQNNKNTQKHRYYKEIIIPRGMDCQALFLKTNICHDDFIVI